jgi:hypothetical protein
MDSVVDGLKGASKKERDIARRNLRKKKNEAKIGSTTAEDDRARKSGKAKAGSGKGYKR